MSSNQHAWRALMDGVHTVSQTQRIIGPSLADALKHIKPGQDYEDFRTFSHARHTIDSHASRPEYHTGMTLEKAQAAMKDFAKRPKDVERYTEAADQMMEFNNSLILMLADAGVFSAAEAAVMINAHKTYLPLERVRASAAGRLARYVKGTATVNSPVKGRTAKGSGEQILDPLESTIRRAQRFYSAATRKQVQIQLARELDPYFESAAPGGGKQSGSSGLGRLMESVTPLKMKTEVELGRVLKQLVDLKIITEQEAADLIASEPDKLEAMLTVWGWDYKPDALNHIIRITVNGRHRLYQLDPTLHEALLTLEPAAGPWFVRVFGAFTKLVKTGAVSLNPSFALPNMARDWIAFQKNAKYAGAESPLSPLYWTGQFIASASRAAIGGKEHEVIRLYDEMGGRVVSRLGYGNRSVRAARNELIGGRAKSLGRKAALKVSRPLDTYQSMIAASEIGPRLAEFAAALRAQGYYHKDGKIVDKNGNRTRPPRAVLVEAIMASNDVTLNYKRRGQWGHTVDQFIPFFNAAIQGLDKQARIIAQSAREVRALARTGDASNLQQSKRLAIWAAAFASAHIAWLMMRGDDDDVVEQEDWMSLYWTFVDDEGDPTIKIPKGFEEAIYFAVIDTIWRTAFGKNNERKSLWKDSLSAATSRIMPNDTVSGITPVLEVLSDTSFFRHAPIEGKQFQNVGKQYRFRPQTTQLARAMGKFLGGEDDSGLSPLQIEHLLEQYSGGMYGRTYGAMERLARGEGRFADVPGLSGVTVNRDYPKSPGEFYDALRRAELDANNAKAEGSEAEGDVIRFSVLNRYGDLMKAVRNQRPNTTDRDELFAYDRLITGMARSALDLEDLDRYQDPLKMTREDREKLPAGVKEAIESEIGRVMLQATENPEPEWQNEDTDESYARRTAERAMEIKKGQVMLGRVRNDAEDRRKIFDDYWFGRGFTDSDSYWARIERLTSAGALTGNDAVP